MDTLPCYLKKSYFFARWRTRLPDAHTQPPRLARHSQGTAAARARIGRSVTGTAPLHASRAQPDALLARCGAKRCCQCKSSLQQHCKYLHHNTICAHCVAALAEQMLAHSPAIAAQSTADDLALLLCSLLDHTLTSMLCTSCSFLQHAAQRHSRATLPVRRAFGKRSRARVPLRHRAPFATYMAGASRPTAPSTRRSLDDQDRQRLRHLPMTPSSRPPSPTRSRRAT